MSGAAQLPAALGDWLSLHADALDDGSADPERLVPELAVHGLFRVGVPESLGGAGGSLGDAVELLARVAERSLTAAFVLWGQRTFVEYLRVSPNEALRERLLAPLLAGEVAGATGLSNALKFLSGI
ncbi:MAG TPA: acyl-CoA dehydrogenase family protein, partial [Polyangiaceae bacterium]|nr:acyl-CoA dehydrogenase family protein [Polyangiaceae bacterium]